MSAKELDAVLNKYSASKNKSLLQNKHSKYLFRILTFLGLSSPFGKKLILTPDTKFNARSDSLPPKQSQTTYRSQSEKNDMPYYKIRNALQPRPFLQ